MWVSAAIETDAAHADALSNALLAVGAISVTVEDALAGTEAESPKFGEPEISGRDRGMAPWTESRVTALFDPAADVASRVVAATEAVGIDGPPAIRLEDVGEQDWVRLTQTQFAPIQVDHRLWIVPSWHEAPDAGAINLVLDPGLAFGTGSHPTTFLCLQWLSETLMGGETVLDYGCGSGILGIAAAKLGARSVLAVDIDDNALLAARANAANNNVSLQLRHSRQALDEKFDIVVANILTNPLCLLAPLLGGCLAPRGRIALCGVLSGQADLVMAAYAPLIALCAGTERDGWVRLEGVRC